MAVTVASQIARLRRMFSEITDTVAMEYLQYAHRELCFDIPVYTLEETVLPDGTNQTYTLNSDDLRVWSATYYYTSTYSRPLKAMTKRSMELKASGWRNTPATVPTTYAVYKESDVLKLFLYPIPATASAGGYPKVVLRVSRFYELSDSGDLPSSVVAPDIYALKAALMYAVDHDLPSRIMELTPQVAAAMRRNLQGLDYMVVDAPPTTTMGARYPSVTR